MTVTMHRRENASTHGSAGRGDGRDRPRSSELTFVTSAPQPCGAQRLPRCSTDNFLPLEPLGYEEMVALLSASELAVSDSGGIQEEGAALECRLPWRVT